MAEEAGNPAVSTGSVTENGSTASSPALDTWKQYIPEDMKEEAFWNDVPDEAALVKGYGHQRKFIGSAVRIPGDDATPEQVASFYKKLGRPDDPKGYQIEGVEGVDKLPADVVEWFKQVAFDQGLPQKAFSGVLSKYGDLFAGMQEMNDDKIAAEAHQTAEILKRADQWGANYDRNMAWARRAVQKLGSDETLAKIEKLGLGSDIPFMTLFYNVGRQMAEHGIIPGEPSGGLSVEAAKVRVGELMARPEYMDARKPGHKELVDQVQALYQVIYE